MINKDELLFAVDESNNPIEPVTRQKAHAEGVWHRTTDIAVINSKGEILCHKRSMLKDSGPGLWDPCFGGHILADADSLMNALQELKEESGLDAASDELEFVAIIKHVNQKNNEFRYAYIYKWDGKIGDLELEKDEIDEAKWVSLEVIKNNRDNRAEWSPMPYLDALLRSL